MFKNAKIYDLVNVDLSSLKLRLADVLRALEFTSCTKHQLSSAGFVNVIYDDISLTTKDRELFCYQIESKLLPSTVVNDYVQAKIDEIEKQESYKPGRKHRDQIKEDVILELLPRAFSKYRKIYAYIDYKLKILVIDTASSTIADDIVLLLRKGLETFPVLPISTEKISQILKNSILSRDKTIGDFIIGHSCDMRESEDSKATIKSKNIFIGDEIVELATSMEIVALELQYKNLAFFTLASNGLIKSFTLTDGAIESLDDYEDKSSRLKADFELVSGTLRAMFIDLDNKFKLRQLSDQEFFG